MGLGGRGFMVDLKSNEWRHESVEKIRQQADSSDAPSDQTLSPENLWRRTTDDFIGGAGQRYRDRENSSARRFWKSYGIDVWTEGQFSLLPTTTEWEDSSDSNLYMVVAGARCYFSEGQTTKYRTDLAGSATTVTSTHASAVTSLTSTGYWVLIGCSDGIYRTNTGTSAATKWSSLVPGVVGYVKQRLVASGTGASKHILYSLTDDLGGGSTPYAAPSAAFTHPDSNFTWVGFCAGPTTQHIYAAGYSGDKSLIYKWPLKDDGTGLDVPIVAAELPDGEIVRSIGEYLGNILIGTDEGVRFAVTQGDGELELGALLTTGSPVRCFEGQGPYVWFGWEGMDATWAGYPGLTTVSGLGRMSLLDFASTEKLAPAYASDLMVAGSAQVVSVVTFGGVRVFSVAGVGFQVEDDDLVEYGALVGGFIDYRLPETKTAYSLRVMHEGDGGLYAALGVDGAEPSTNVLSLVPSDDQEYNAGQARGRTFEWLVALRLEDDVAPTVQAVTLLADPVIETVEWIYVPLLLHTSIDLWGEHVPRSPQQDRTFLEGLRRSGRLTTYQAAARTWSVIVADFVWVPHDFERPNGSVVDVNGTWVAKLKVIP